MELFNSLPRVRQRILLRKLAEKALIQYGIEDASIKFITDTTNTIFSVQTSKQRYVLRVEPEPASEEQAQYILEELQWLNSISQDTDLRVPNPVLSKPESFVEHASVDEIPEGKLITLFHWMPGKLVGNRISPQSMAQLGKTAAQLHHHADNYCFPKNSTRDTIDWPGKIRFWQDPQVNTTSVLSAKERETCQLVSEPLIEEISKIKEQGNFGLIHSDLHQTNCLWHKKQLCLIDFHDCCIASYFYDLAVPLTYIETRQNYEHLKEAFFKHYLIARNLPDNFENAVNTYMLARAFDIIEWIYYYWPDIVSFSEGKEILNTAIRRIEKYRVR